MAQGKAKDKEKTIELLRPFFELGCSVTKACNYGGIPQSTVQTWIDADESLRLKITLWQNKMNYKARENWQASINKGELSASQAWLSKKEKDEFSDRTEMTGADGGPVVVETITGMTIAKE